jgi:peptidoglycan/xylan/chitin deacetylase (PgdA/CDA1 family)
MFFDMKWYWIKTNRLIKKMFPNYIWDLPPAGNKVYLTFDDGPTPEITTWVLDQLRQYKAKATFFCIGDNVKKQIEICQLIRKDGHQIGNHTFNHLNGWNTDMQKYVANVHLCEETLLPFKSSKSQLFRPPYGKVSKRQADQLLSEGYKIIMWDVLSADFDQNISPEKCLQNVIKNVTPGSIIVFHDSVKSFKNLEFTLPRFLNFLKQNNYVCEVID